MGAFKDVIRLCLRWWSSPPAEIEPKVIILYGTRSNNPAIHGARAVTPSIKGNV